MGYTVLENYKVISLDKIPSTQIYATELILQHKISGPTIILAKAQTNGYGRYNRKWVSHHGNLYVSFVFESKNRDARLSYRIAVAVAETLTELNIKPSIKWPNDILVEHKKISGILIEYIENFVVIGIGINISTCPTIANYKTTKILNYTNTTIQIVLKKLSCNISKWLNAPFSMVRSRWGHFAEGLNHIVKYRDKDAQLIGLNDNGALILRIDSAYHLVYGDEIYL